jgi:pilus assembly protein Flp/PilA
MSTHFSFCLFAVHRANVVPVTLKSPAAHYHQDVKHKPPRQTGAALRGKDTEMMTQIKQVVVDWMNDEEGASLVEYVLLVGLIALVCIGAVTALGKGLNTKFQAATDGLTPPAGP